MSNEIRKHAPRLLALLLVGSMAPPLHAEHRRSEGEPRATEPFARRQIAEQRISIQQAIAIVQRETGGRVLDARDQGQQYRIKILTRKGEVRIVYVDARTGAVR